MLAGEYGSRSQPVTLHGAFKGGESRRIYGEIVYAGGTRISVPAVPGQAIAFPRRLFSLDATNYRASEAGS